MNVRLPARIGAFACLGVAVAMAALAFREAPQPGDTSQSRTAVATSTDPLQARMSRCQQAGEAAGSDRDCLAAWAENRRRFLGLGARPAGPHPSPGTRDVPPSATGPAGTAPAVAPPQEH